MVIELQIATNALHAIRWEAGRSPAHEVCGLLLGEGPRVTAVAPARNVDPDPASGFEIDPAVLLVAHRRRRGGGPAIIGCYHSHPRGGPEPSARDGRSASVDLPYWIIATPRRLSCWRFTGTGPFFGFEPIGCRHLPAGCTAVAPSPQGGNPFASIRTAA